MSSKAPSRPSAIELSASRAVSRSARPIFKLAEAAENSWRRLDGHNQLPKVVFGVKFAGGIEVVKSQAQAAAA
jgi:hypothetical protein